MLLLSATAWVLMLAAPQLMTGHAGHGAAAPSAVVDGHLHADMQAHSANHPAVTGALDWAAGWALMLVAMMLPTLISPIHHILDRSFKRRRARSILLFVVGYAAIWMPVGMVLTAAILWIGRAASAMPAPGLLPALGIGLIAFIWQCSPAKQRCLNRNHNHRELAAFGRRADMDALRFGLDHGWWCVGSCWALMMLPMVMSAGHLVAMAAVTILMISERLAPPRPLDWRLRFPGNLGRILIARGRMGLRRLLPQARPGSDLSSVGTP